MSVTAIISMLFILGVVMGGFIHFLSIAIRKELRDRNHKS